MQFLRLSILFAFFALSIAKAACTNATDFEIFANRTSLGCNAVVSTQITYGDSLTFYISPANGKIEWKVTNTVIDTGYKYTPIFTENANKTITYLVERNGISKTISIQVQVRPGYTVSFDTDGGTPSISFQSVLKDSLAKKPTENLTKTGYDFDGWNFNFSTPITKDTTINAKWKTKIYTVSFYTDGGSTVASQKVNYYSTASVPTPAPTKAGKDFEGWDFDFNTPITKDTTINAKWKEKLYTIGLFFKGTVKFENQDFDLDTLLSDKQRYYYVAGQSLCSDSAKMKSTIIHITFKETDVSIRINNIPQPNTIDENGRHYDIPFKFDSLGLNTRIYELISNNGLHSEFDTISIETPIPYDAIIKQKWNNVLFVNNNPKTNGFHTSFKDFKWFKNDLRVGNNSQFYSAILDTNDSYRVEMKTEKDARISSCGGHPKKYQEPTPITRTKKIKTKQVLGIKEKSLNSGSKVYNLNGKLAKETPAGVYIVEE